MAKTHSWDRINELFEQAVSLPTSEQNNLLKETEEKEPGIAREVRELLKSFGDATGFFDGMEGEIGDALHQMVEDPLLQGTEIGDYTIAERIGSGGMSVIYRAERHDQEFHQSVAIKVLKKGLDTDDILRRFRSEKQILARLTHPAIAQIFDGGATDAGTPYFVMEFIQGLPFDRYLLENQLSLAEKISLFLKICKPIQHAHRNLVVHRDLKPSNILITQEGNVKLLDFGIAKLLIGDQEAYTAYHTQAGQQLLTPEYAAPEQMADGAITTSTDVYQLGLILYEMLAEHRPFDFSEKSPSERSQIIQQESPVAPSQRHSDKRIGRLLNGDLDTIVLKALRKEPERRYASVEQLTQDLESYLEGKPIRARKDTWGYRLGKYYQRNRVPVILAVIATLLLTSLSIIYTIRLAQERDLAQQERNKAQQTAEFMQGLFYQTSELTVRGEEVTPEKLLKLGVEKLDTMSVDPSTLAYLYQAVGLTYMGMGLEEYAEKPLLKAFALRPEEDKAGQAEADAYLTLGTIYYSRGLNREADSLLQISLAINNTLAQPEYSSMINLLVSLSELAINREEYEKAQGYADRAQELALAKQDTNSEFYANVLFAQGYCHLVQEHYPQAEESMGDMRSLALRLSGGNPSPLLAGACHNLAEVLVRQGKLQEARIMEEEGVHAYRTSIQAPSTYFLDMLKTLGTITFQLKEYETSLAVQQEVREISQILYGDDEQMPPAYASTLLDLSELYRTLGHMDSSVSTGYEALSIEKRQLPADDPEIGITHLSLARTHMTMMELTRAQQHLDTAISILNLLPAGHSRQLQVQIAQGELFRAAGDYKRSVELLLATSDQYKNQAKIDRAALATSLMQLADSYAGNGEKEKAQATLQEARTFLTNDPSELHELMVQDINQQLDALD